MMWRFLSILLAALFAHAPIAGLTSAAPGEICKFDPFALYVPANGADIRGILLALGGPDTRAFLTGGAFGAPNSGLEASLHILGQELRALAAEHGLAMLGTSLHGNAELPDKRQTDEVIFTAIEKAAQSCGGSELQNAPIFLYGISGGSPQAIGFTARNPERVAALLLKVPAPPQRLDSAIALAVPTFLVLAEHDTFADNNAVAEVFAFNRRAGGLWALAMEPGVPHHSLTPAHRAMTVNWLRAIVNRRLGATAGDPLRAIPESSGWLGQPDTGVSNWNDYPEDRRAANWFPSGETAGEWWQFVRGKP